MNGNDPVIDPGTLNLNSSRPPGTAGMPAGKILPLMNTLLFDAHRLHTFFQATARNNSFAKYTKLRPIQSTDRDSIGVRAIIHAMPDAWLPVELEDLPDGAAIEKEVSDQANEFGKQFLIELDERGVRGATTYLDDLQAQQENAVAAVKSVFAQAAKQNSDAVRIGERFQTGLAVVKCASTITVAAIGLPVVAAGLGLAAGSSLAAFGVGTAYSVGLSVVKNWDDADSAKLVFISAEQAAVKTGQKAAKETGKFFKGVFKNEAQDEGAALRKIEWLSKRIKESARPRDIRRLKAAEVAAQTAKNAGRLATAFKAVPYIFFVWSAIGAVQTLRDDLPR